MIYPIVVMMLRNETMGVKSLIRDGYAYELVVTHRLSNDPKII